LARSWLHLQPQLALQRIDLRLRLVFESHAPRDLHADLRRLREAVPLDGKRGFRLRFRLVLVLDESVLRGFRDAAEIGFEQASELLRRRVDDCLTFRVVVVDVFFVLREFQKCAAPFSMSRRPMNRPRLSTAMPILFRL
jgi:hypothetical protein